MQVVEGKKRRLSPSDAPTKPKVKNKKTKEKSAASFGGFLS
jgi:hypothetical protein